MRSNKLELKEQKHNILTTSWYFLSLLFSDFFLNKTLNLNKKLLMIFGKWLRAKSLQLCLTVWDPMHCSPPGSSVYGILQARILDWVALYSSKGSSQPRDYSILSLVHFSFLFNILKIKYMWICEYIPKIIWKRYCF